MSDNIEEAEVSTEETNSFVIILTLAAMREPLECAIIAIDRPASWTEVEIAKELKELFYDYAENVIKIDRKQCCQKTYDPEYDFCPKCGGRLPSLLPDSCEIQMVAAEAFEDYLRRSSDDYYEDIKTEIFNYGYSTNPTLDESDCIVYLEGFNKFLEDPKEMKDIYSFTKLKIK